MSFLKNLELASFIEKLNLAQPTWDLFIVLLFLMAAFLYGMSLGRDRILVILIAVYMALAVVNNAPFASSFRAEMKINEMFAFRVTTFLGMFVALFFFLSRSALLRSFGAAGEYGSWWQVIIFSFLHVGLLMSVTLSFLPSAALQSLAPLTQMAFAGNAGRFFWIIAPIAAMLLFVREKKT